MRNAMSSEGVRSPDNQRLTLAGEAPIAPDKSNCVQPSSRRRKRSLSAAPNCSSPMAQFFPIGNNLSTGKSEKVSHHTVAMWQHARVALGENLRHLMAERQIGRQELLKKSGLSPPTLHRYINGDRDTRPSYKHVAKIAEALKVEPQVLLGPPIGTPVAISAPPLRTNPLEKAAAEFDWNVPTHVIKAVMDRARAEASATEQADWYWGLRLRELVDEVQGAQPTPIKKSRKS